jgi:hypothetical protein
MLQRDDVVMMVMMMMMIPMKPSSMMVTMAMISPLAYRRAFSLCVFFAPQRRRSLFAILPPVLHFREDDIHEGALAEVGQGGHTTWWRSQGLARTWGWCGPLVAHLSLSFLLLPSSGKIGILGVFLEL